MATHKKQLTIGVVMLISFFVVLFIMFSPVFDGKNAFQASDDLFNSLAKGSTNFFERMAATAKTHDGKALDLTITVDGKYKDGVIKVLAGAGMTAAASDKGVSVKGDYGKLLAAMNADSETAYYNKGAELQAKYGMEARAALYMWYNISKGLTNSFNDAKMFAEAKDLNSVVTRSLEVGYNFFGIEPKKVADKALILGFSLVFYVFYTLWFGYGIMYTFNGLGFAMKAGKKKEA